MTGRLTWHSQQCCLGGSPGAKAVVDVLLKMHPRPVKSSCLSATLTATLKTDFYDSFEDFQHATAAARLD